MIWIVVPSYNEAQNLPHLIPRIVESAECLQTDYRVLVVNDGSTDTSHLVMEKLCAEYSTVSIESILRNRGKANALRIGFNRATVQGASVVIMMDADGQDDPRELPKLLAAIDSGYDLVTGARIQRNDRFVKRVTSRWFNYITGSITRTPGKDLNSGFKVMTAKVATEISPMLYGDLHRYITVIGHWLGFRVTEVPVAHHERVHGSTKYGVSRFWRGFLDLITIRFLMSYERRPSHLFGGLGVLSGLVGLVMLVFLLFQRFSGSAIGDRPMLLAAILLVIIGLQLILFGLLAELIVFLRSKPLLRS